MNLKKIIHWSLFSVIILYVISGLGILYYQIITTITFGLLNKNVSFAIHNYLLIPFLILLIAHIIITRKSR